MNRIVRERYPVSKLPKELRKEFPGQDEVTLTIESQANFGLQDSGRDFRESQSPLAPIDENEIRGGDFSRYKHLRRAHFKSSEEVDAYLSGLRDEWAHR